MANLACGIVGLPNVGKSTLFNALTANEADAQNYPFCTIDPNVGVVLVPDDRLAKLSAISGSKQLLPATMEFVDIAGLVEGASKGEGLGNQFLAHIREVDAIVHVVRCFDSGDIIHVAGKVDPISDIEVINLELALSDLQTVQKILPRIEKQSRIEKELRPLADLLKRLETHLNDGKQVRDLEMTDNERALLKPYPLLTGKRVIYVANVSEDSLPSLENDYVRKVRDYAAKEGSEVIPICAKLEQEIAQLPEAERAEFLTEVGITEPGLNRLIRRAFSLLGLITYLTTGEKETRAWTIIAGTAAPGAAGRIHTDIEKGFIRAEVASFDDMVQYKGWVGVREAGKARIEGKEYIVKDGDVILFRHA